MPSINSSEPVILPVRDGEEPWTPEEIWEQREVLVERLERPDKKAAATDSELSGLLLQSNDGAGRNPADVGSSNFERDWELSPTQSAREMVGQARLTPHLFDEGQYGLCEVCGSPIGKGRFQVFPRVTMCVVCKQREECR